MSERPGLVILVSAALLLAGLPGAASAHPRHPAAHEQGAQAEPAPAPARPTVARRPFLPHHAPPPFALAAGALGVLAQVVARRRRLALGLVLVVAAAGVEGVFHASLHLHDLSHPDGLSIGASAAAPTALRSEPELPPAPTPLLLGPVPDRGREPEAGMAHASHHGRAPPPFLAA